MAEGDGFRRERGIIQKAKISLFADTRAEIMRILQLGHAEILARIAQLGESDFELMTQLTALQQAIEDVMAQITDQSNGIITPAMANSFDLGVSMVDDPLRAEGISLAGLAPSLDLRQLDAMVNFSTNRIRGANSDTVNRINQQLGLAMLGTQTISQATDEISNILTGARSRILGIVRTEMGTAYSSATQGRMEQAKEFVPALQKQWRRSGKVHSRTNHDAVDGQVRNVEDDYNIVEMKTKRTISIRFPRDPRAPIGERINCGCDSLPYNEAWEVRNKGHKPFTQRELEGDSPSAEGRRKLAAGQSIREII